MKLNELKPPKGAFKERKRVGRGHAAGGGKTAGRGQKGAKSRSGASKFLGYEGGQNPLQRRVPKLPGFRNMFKKEYQIINLSDISEIAATKKINIQLLKEKRLIKSEKKPVKLLGNGEIKSNITIEVNACSHTAIDKIEKAGGKVEIIRC